MFHGWMFDPDGAHAAAVSTRSSTNFDTGWSVNPRTDRRLVTASYTSIIAYPPPASASASRLPVSVLSLGMVTEVSFGEPVEWVLTSGAAI
jgi:hypothetical protein